MSNLGRSIVNRNFSAIQTHRQEDSKEREEIETTERRDRKRFIIMSRSFLTADLLSTDPYDLVCYMYMLAESTENLFDFACLLGIAKLKCT